MDRLTDHRGETLLEILITVVVIGIGMVAVVGMMGTSIVAADANRQHAQAEVISRDFAEAVRAEAAKPTATPTFDPCPDAAYLTPTGYAPPPGWTAQITKVEWWIRNDNLAVLPNGSFTEVRADCVAKCPVADCQPGLDSGLQRVTVLVENTRTDDAGAMAFTSRFHVRRGNP